MNNCKIRLVEESDIPILFEHLKQFLEVPNASTTGNPLPLFENSKKFVMKYLYENENHEYDKWYMVINDEDEILGNVYIKKKNIISYHILEKYQRQGFGEKAWNKLSVLNLAATNANLLIVAEIEYPSYFL